MEQSFQPPPPKQSNASGRKHSYGQIVKSSALVGGSSVMNLAIAMIRGKAMALLLGPAGVGLIGLCQSLVDLGKNFAGLGIGNSGVRQMAEAVGTGDKTVFARTVTTLRGVTFWLGLLGAVVMLALCQPLSHYALKGKFSALETASLSLAVFFGTVSAGQIAMIQGTRRIKDLATVSVLGALLGTLIAVPVVWYFRHAGNAKNGVIPSIICVTGLAALISWWFSNKIKVEHQPMRWSDLSGEVSVLLKLGFVFMTSSLMTTGVAALVRIILLRRLGEDATGYYQSAWVLGGYYVGFILQAMGADFFPRLTAVSKNNEECNRLVNEQAEVSLLLAGPGILATLSFAPLVIYVFYTSKFGQSVEILRWICLGMMLRVVSWPMGYILLAKGARLPFFCTEVAGGLAQVAFVWVGIRIFELNGAGRAFFASYVFYTIMIYFVVRYISGFRWSRSNRRLGIFFGILIALVFTGWYFIDQRIMTVIGGLASVISGYFCLRKLCRMIPMEKLPNAFRRIAEVMGVVPKTSVS